MERYNCTCHCGGSMFYKHLRDPSCDLFMYGEEAPQSKEAQLQAALDAEREKVAKLEKIQAIDLKNNNEYREQLATLQAQLADRDAMILQMGEQAAVLAKENMAVKAQLRQVEGERAKWEDIAGLRFAGDHKFVKEMELLKVENTTLRQLVEALPVVDGRMDVECGACYYIRSFIAGQYGVVCGLITEQSTAMAIKALLEYRATQAAQDAPHPTEERS